MYHRVENNLLAMERNCDWMSKFWRRNSRFLERYVGHLADSEAGDSQNSSLSTYLAHSVDFDRFFSTVIISVSPTVESHSPG